jgi:hypothetical protein
MGLRASAHAPYLLQCTLHFEHGSDTYLKEQKPDGSADAGRIRGDLERTEREIPAPFRCSDS